MSRRKIKTAMALAAGYGLRMRPITDRMPKPLVAVGGRTLLDRLLDRFAEAGVETAVVNTHYKGEMIAEHLAGRERPRIVLSPEETLLETGGGVANALPLLGVDENFKGRPFFVANSDAIWVDGYRPALERLARQWDGRRMDALLLLVPTATIWGYTGRGDYGLDPDGTARRRREREISPFLFAGVQILHPRLFRDAPEGKFSLNLLYDRAEAAGRLHGIRHDGAWYHVGTPDSIPEVEAALAGRSHRLDWV